MWVKGSELEASGLYFLLNRHHRLAHTKTHARSHKLNMCIGVGQRILYLRHFKRKHVISSVSHPSCRREGWRGRGGGGGVDLLTASLWLSPPSLLMWDYCFFSQGKVKETASPEMNVRYLLSFDTDKFVPVARKRLVSVTRVNRLMINCVSHCYFISSFISLL